MLGCGQIEVWIQETVETNKTSFPSNDIQYLNSIKKTVQMIKLDYIKHGLCPSTYSISYGYLVKASFPDWMVKLQST